MPNWKPFPHDNSDFLFEGAALAKNWDGLHAGDQEPLPDNEDIQQAWRLYHAGLFGEAVELADEIGIEAHAVANKSTGIYATYLEDNGREQVNCFMAAMDRAEQAIEAFPEDPNSHYFRAFNMGRYSQSISVVKALKQGIGGKIQESLKQVLALNPNHADAHTAMGMYHAEIIDKVGKLLGGVTYGASEKDALEHFETAIALVPLSPIAHIEYGNGLYLLYGDNRIDDVSALYTTATELTPRDAMETLDIEAALAEFE